MRCFHVCTLPFILASINFLTALVSHLQLEKDSPFDDLPLGPIFGHDDQLVTTNGSLQSSDLDRARSKDLMSFKEQTSTTAYKRSPNIYRHVRNRSRSKDECSLPISERSILIGLATSGFRLVWDYMDITYTTYIAFYQTTELWGNITANARGKWKAEEEVMTLDISYGCLKLSIAGLIDAISWEFVAEFAAEMLVLSHIIVFGAYRLVVFANWWPWLSRLHLPSNSLVPPSHSSLSRGHRPDFGSGSDTSVTGQ